jgi:hypothetical protein
LKLFLEIVNNTSHNHGKSQSKLLFIFGLDKKTILEIWKFTTQIYIFVFLCSSKYKVFGVDFLHTFVRSSLTTYIIFPSFLDLKIYFLFVFLKLGALILMWPNLCSLYQFNSCHSTSIIANIMYIGPTKILMWQIIKKERRG